MKGRGGTGIMAHGRSGPEPLSDLFRPKFCTTLNRMLLVCVCRCAVLYFVLTSDIRQRLQIEMF